MDTPEGDISAIQSGRMQPLPAYQEHDSPQNDTLGLVSAVDPSDTRHLPPSYDKTDTSEIRINETGEASHDSETFLFPKSLSSSTEHLHTSEGISELQAKRNTTYGFFVAIDAEQYDAVALFLSENLVTANTTTEEGRTPLLAAVATKNIQIVQQLLDAGAEADTYGVVLPPGRDGQSTTGYYNYVETKRTPLQLAASIGHLPLVKLFIENYHCNDALIAPDGQIALRLAASNGHREVVAYLPSRRGGGFLRWQVQHKKSLLRAKKACKRIYAFLKFFLFDIEKFFLWTCPKQMIVKPLVKGCNWCWERKQNVGPWIATQARATPERTKRFGKWIWKGLKKVPKAAQETGKATWRGLKKVPKAIHDISKAIWEFLTVDLPKAIKKISRWIWNLLTVRIPKVSKIIAEWIWSLISATGKAIWNVVLKTASLLHTFFSAIASFFRELTMKDILNGIRDVLRSIFVAFPKILWTWIWKFGDVSFKTLAGLFGVIGMLIWYLGVGIVWLVGYLPAKVFEVLGNLGVSLGKGLHEILVWFSPKA